MPDVLHDRQTEAAFMPDVHLPTIPMAVDTEQKFLQQIRRKNPQELQFLGMDETKAEGALGVALGDKAELDLFKELKKYQMVNFIFFVD